LKIILRQCYKVFIIDVAFWYCLISGFGPSGVEYREYHYSSNNLNGHQPGNQYNMPHNYREYLLERGADDLVAATASSTTAKPDVITTTTAKSA
jgi:hypothetical protein